MISLSRATKMLKTTETVGVFEIEALYPGYGATIGNSLRRVLLSSLEGAAVTQVKIKGGAHEFDTIEGIAEDVLRDSTILGNKSPLHPGWESCPTSTPETGSLDHLDDFWRAMLAQDLGCGLIAPSGEIGLNAAIVGRVPEITMQDLLRGPLPV